MGACMHGQKSLRYKEQTDLKYKQLEKVDRDRMDFASHRWIGALISHDKNGSCAYGTAVLISSDLILTVAHNIYNSDSKSQYLNFRFYLAPCGAVKEGIEIKKGSWRFPQGFKTSRSDVRYYYDYAIMKLSQPVQLLREPLALHVMCRQHRDEFKKAELSIYGYPKHSSNYEVREGSEEMELIQYGQTRKDLFHNITEDYRCIEYYISTLPGHSGSPLINSGNIIGLHFGGGIDDSQSYNKGMLITSEVMEQLIIWETELGGSPFIVENERMCPHIPEKIRENAQQRALNRKVQINSAGLRHIDMECYNHFRQINLQTNLLVNIDLSKNKVLSKLYLGQNQLTEIDLRENKMLTHLRLSKNQLRAIDLGMNYELTYVDLSSNQLQEISLINNRKIKRLWLSENRLRWVNFWWSGILQIHLENQESALCNVDILHRSDDKQGCLRMVQIQETRYNNPSNERTANRHCCAYLFNPVKQV